MFNCEQCGKTSATGEPANKQVVATRIKNYRNTIRVKEKEEESQEGEERPARPARRRDTRPQYLETQGTEIVKERTVCSSCAGVGAPKVAPPVREERAANWWSPGLLPGIVLS